MNAIADEARDLVIRMALALGCRVNDWIRKAFSSKKLGRFKVAPYSFLSARALI